MKQKLYEWLNVFELVLPKLDRVNSTFLCQFVSNSLQVFVVKLAIIQIYLKNKSIAFQTRKQESQRLLRHQSLQMKPDRLLLVNRPHNLTDLLDRITLHLLILLNFINQLLL